MGTTWDTLNGKLSYFLEDVVAVGEAPQHPTQLRITSWNWAQDQFCAHTARPREVELVLNEDGRSAAVPTDFFEMGHLYDPSNAHIWHRRNFQEGGYRSDSDEELAWWMWGNTLHLEASVTGNLQLHYYATWPSVEYRMDGTDLRVVQPEIHIPQWAEFPLTILTAAFVLHPAAIASARNREYNIRIDSGTPLDNARAAQARELWNWYKNLMALHTPQTR